MERKLKIKPGMAIHVKEGQLGMLYWLGIREPWLLSKKTPFWVTIDDSGMVGWMKEIHPNRMTGERLCKEYGYICVECSDFVMERAGAIDLNKIRFALFDFDDTLYIHNEHAYQERGVNYREKVLYANVTGNMACLYNRSGYNEHMHRFLAECKATNIPMGMISATDAYSSIPKLRWIRSVYGVDMHNLCTANAEDKVDVALSLAKTFDMKPSEILLIDDYWKVIANGANAGIKAVTTIEIINYVTDSKNR